ncbi:MAG: FKBP-type peptidyl-prolyl cis-trans isomerase SlyD [Motiliproteus sp.]|jgi:FKBP-type peptidyl-prolyl cis-trans isomerase SlyD
MQIADNKVALIHYTLTNNEGEVLDSSEGAEPLSYLHGQGNLIPGLEKELLGKRKGDALDVSVTAEEAYGPVVEEMIQVVPREAFDGVEEIQVGMRFEASTTGEPVSVIVTALDAENVTVDGNHPLAGQALNFKVEVVEVREPNANELPQAQEAHVHSADCNH